MDKSSTVDHIALCWTLWTIISTNIVITVTILIKPRGDPNRCTCNIFFTYRRGWTSSPSDMFLFLYIPELYAPGSRGLNGISRVKWNRNMSPYEAPVRMGPPEGIVCWAAVWSDRNLVIFGEKLTRLCQQSPLNGYYKIYSAAQPRVSGLWYWKEKKNLTL